MIDIKNALNTLGLKDLNNGTSVGSLSFGSGKKIDSFSSLRTLVSFRMTMFYAIHPFF